LSIPNTKKIEYIFIFIRKKKAFYAKINLA
jgi:hypothetical protein